VQDAPKHLRKPKAKTKHTRYRRYRIYAGHPIQHNKNHPYSTNIKQPQSRLARGQIKGKEADVEGIRGRKTKIEAQNQTASKISLTANTSTSTPTRKPAARGSAKTEPKELHATKHKLRKNFLHKNKEQPMYNTQDKTKIQTRKTNQPKQKPVSTKKIQQYSFRLKLYDVLAHLTCIKKCN